MFLFLLAISYVKIYNLYYTNLKYKFNNNPKGKFITYFNARHFNNTQFNNSPKPPKKRVPRSERIKVVYVNDNNGHFNDIPLFLMPTVTSKFNKNGNQSSPTYIEEADSVLTPIASYSTKMKNAGPVDINNIIKINASYKNHIKIREHLWYNRRGEITQYKPGTLEAWQEFTKYILAIAVNKYPYVFKIEMLNNNKKYFHNLITGLNYDISNIDDLSIDKIFKILTLNFIEDFNLLSPEGVDEDLTWYLKGTISSCAIGWHPRERIGWEISTLHNKAPYWEEGNGSFAKAYAKAFAQNCIGSLVFDRDSMFFANSSEFYLPENIFKTRGNNIIGISPGFRAKDVYLRREYQIFFRVPKTNCIFFVVKTYSQDLTTLNFNDLKALEGKGSFLNTKEYQSKYHQVDAWLPILIDHINKLENK